MLDQSTVAKIFGFVFLAVGLLGFIPNPIVGDPGAAGEAQERTGAAEDGAIFGTNALHNIVHLLSGLVALGAGFSSEAYSKMYNVGFGAVYAVVTLLGFLGVGFVVDLLALNTADNVLHLLITAVLLAVGLGVAVEDPATA